MQPILGVVGLGVVGNAFAEGMKHVYDIRSYDRSKSCTERSAADLVDVTTKAIFVCVPTPMRADGSCDLSIVDSVLQELAKASSRDHHNPSPQLVVIKSTIPPGSTLSFINKYSGLLHIAFNPEFLTEASPVEDFRKQDRIIVGAEDDVSRRVAAIYQVAYPGVVVKMIDPTTAELVKYVTNSFLALKVSFANEVYQICKGLGANYDRLMDATTLDKRLGTSHWRVPGPDGHFGFGLTCFPKDLNALISLAKNLGVLPLTMEAAWQKNLEVRPERDWEKMKGRAVS